VTLRSFLTRNDFVEAVVNAVAAAIAETLPAKERVNLLLPGGSTARSIVPHLSALPLSWDRIDLSLTDERWVPADHPDSNEGLIRSLMASKAAARIIGLYRRDLSAAAAADEFNMRALSPDIVLLGMGTDGHIASIFPHSKVNFARVPFAAENRPDHWRVTLTPAALKNASRIIIATNGADKQSTLQAAYSEGPAELLPVRHAIRLGAAAFVGP
jgi:6-phosphogluconolactonase